MRQIIVFLIPLLVAKGFADEQLVGFPPLVGNSVVDIILDGGEVASNGQVLWQCDDEPEVNITIRNPTSSLTNVTLYKAGTYNCHYNNTSNNVTKETTIYVVPYEQLPVWRLSTSLVQALLHNQYAYLKLSHHFYAPHSFLPNVAKFFQSCMDKSSKMLDQIVTYVLAKHVITEKLDGSNPPDYTYALFHEGFVNTIAMQDEPTITRLQHALTRAFQLELTLVESLTVIEHLAGEIGDGEVGEFVGADLLPPLTKHMKMLTDYKDIVASITENDRHLGEFLFDRQLG